MKYNPNPKKGDPVRVRLVNGKVENVRYDEIYKGKQHYLNSSRGICVAWGKRPSNKVAVFDRVRFVYPIEAMDKPEVRD